jgi:hypothetical protein
MKVYYGGCMSECGACMWKLEAKNLLHEDCNRTEAVQGGWELDSGAFRGRPTVN